MKIGENTAKIMSSDEIKNNGELENLLFYDLSFAPTETKYIKPKTKTQNNIVIFGFFHKKIILLFWLFLK